MNNTPMNPMGGGIGGGYGGPPRGNGFFDRWKLRNEVVASAYRAKIAENNRKEFKEFTEGLHIANTFEVEGKKRERIALGWVEAIDGHVQQVQANVQNQLLKNQGMALENQKLKCGVDQMLSDINVNGQLGNGGNGGNGGDNGPIPL